MSSGLLIAFFLTVAVAAYVHTVSGFAIGMIIMGSAAVLHLAPVPVVAAVVALITLVNGALALPGVLHQVYWRGTLIAIAGVLPATVAGVVLLDFLSASATQLMRALLGVLIVSGGVHMLLHSARRQTCSSQAAFFASGLGGGLLGGLFGIPGPPLIYHFYRQPLSPAVIRNSLLLSFAVMSAGRTVFVAAQGQLTTEVWILTAVSVPAAALATMAGRYLPPPLGIVGMRRFVFAALLVIGGSLIVDGTGLLSHAD